MATDVTQVIRTRLKEIDRELEGYQALQSERERLTRALSELSDGDRPVARRGRRAAGPARTRRAAAKPGRRGGKRAARGSNQQAILGHVGANPGATTPEIADATGIGRPVVYSAVSRLAAGGKLRKSARPDGQVSYEIADGVSG